MSSSSSFLTYIQVSQEAGQVVWFSHLFQNFPLAETLLTLWDSWSLKAGLFLWRGSLGGKPVRVSFSPCGSASACLPTPNPELVTVPVFSGAACWHQIEPLKGLVLRILGFLIGSCCFWWQRCKQMDTCQRNLKGQCLFFPLHFFLLAFWELEIKELWLQKALHAQKFSKSTCWQTHLEKELRPEDLRRQIPTTKNSHTKTVWKVWSIKGKKLGNYPSERPDGRLTREKIVKQLL